MTPLELLEYTKDATQYFLKTNDLSATFPALGSYSVEDVAMDSVVKILESSVHPRTKTYVTEVVRNTCLDLLRRKRITLVEVSPKEADHQLVPLDTLDTSQDTLLSLLSKEDRELYSLRVTQGLTEEPIAAHYGVSTRTIRRRLSELKETLQECLKN